VANTQSPYIPDRPGVAVPTVLSAEELAGKRMRVSTAKGDIVIELFGNTAPIAVSSFVYLAQKGFYDGVIFHRRESWVLQGGDPTGTGSGGAGYRFPEELNDSYGYVRGMVGVAKTMAPSTSGSQFFFMLKDTPLSKDYTIFGKVVSGMDVVDKIEIGDKMLKVTIE
jgi:cyclophilin family peptidyl-prolyl cis-trans isomerase